MADHGVATPIFRPVNLVESVGKQSVLLARDLVNYIAEHELPQGTRLPTEQEMQQQYGVGRNTIREALRLLEVRGVISIKTGRNGGPVVRLPRPTDLGEALQLILQFQGATLLDIIDARRLIEPIAASSAALSHDETLIERLQDTNDTMLAHANEVTFSIQNNLFHSIIGGTLNLPVISVFLDSLKNMHDGLSYGVHYSSERVRLIVRTHQKIIDVIKVGDADGAAQAMSQHLLEARTYWLAKYPESCTQTLRWLGR